MTKNIKPLQDKKESLQGFYYFRHKRKKVNQNLNIFVKHLSLQERLKA